MLIVNKNALVVVGGMRIVSKDDFVEVDGKCNPSVSMVIFILTRDVNR